MSESLLKIEKIILEIKDFLEELTEADDELELEAVHLEQVEAGEEHLLVVQTAGEERKRVVEQIQDHFLLLHRQSLYCEFLKHILLCLEDSEEEVQAMAC